MKYIKGSWRTIISSGDALVLEDSIKKLKTITLDDRNPTMDMARSRRFDRTYHIYLNPETIDKIKGDSNWDIILLPVNYHDAMIRLSYDFRNHIPFCEANIKEAALQLLESYLWLCGHNHKMTAKVLPALANQQVRCPKCGRDMKLARNPLMPKLRDELNRMGLSYTKAIELKTINARVIA